MKDITQVKNFSFWGSVVEGDNLCAKEGLPLPCLLSGVMNNSSAMRKL